MELDPGLQVAEAAGVEDRVGRLEHDCKLRPREHAARERGRERALLERDLLAREEDVARRRPRMRQLEHHAPALIAVVDKEPHTMASPSS